MYHTVIQAIWPGKVRRIAHARRAASRASCVLRLPDKRGLAGAARADDQDHREITLSGDSRERKLLRRAFQATSASSKEFKVCPSGRARKDKLRTLSLKHWWSGTAICLHPPNTASIFNYSQFGSSIDVSHKTGQRYVALLQQVFLVSTLQPWYMNALKRMVKTPKLHFLDSGVLATARGLSFGRVKGDRDVFGTLLESFVSPKS